jgi:nucleotide-binding universal stress UspA family protein
LIHRKARSRRQLDDAVTLKEPVMSFAAILTHVEADAAAQPRLKLAADLANQFGAALIGVAAEIFEPPSAASALGYVDGETLVAEAKAVQDDLKLAEANFAAVAKTLVVASDFRSGVGLPGELVVQQSRAADLIVCGARHPDRWGLHNHADAGDVLMDSGRPVLVVPDGLAKLDASSVLVAWKDTAQSRRAVVDAMPFLTRAKQVLVAEVCEKDDASDARARVADVAEFLARHGVKASTAVREPSKGPAAAALQQMAQMQDAGLIVAGGYGHARLREWVFGGVTQNLLQVAGKAAVLLSH